MTQTTNYGKVVAGNIVATDTVVISAGNLKAGSVLKSTVGDGGEKFSLAKTADATKQPAQEADEYSAVLLEDCDASDGEKTALVLFSGEVNKDSLVFDGTATAADFVSLRKVGIFAKKCI